MGVYFREKELRWDKELHLLGAYFRGENKN